MTDTTQGFIKWHDLKAEVAESRTPEQHREYDEAGPEVEMQIMLTELIYKMRTDAGISQTELARRMGVRQPYISDLERGGRTPTLLTLSRVAEATGNRLRLVPEPA
ncbi:MAG: helix-turn-helix domain-containing protein [Propionibacteriaceae bacterium]|nr:helix-turn-helix domain-containing protein [Propionibacteriaceae bacterium]